MKAKGKSVGVYEKSEETEKSAERRERRREGTEMVRVFGRNLRARVQPNGERFAADGGGVVDPQSVQSYLHRAFGPSLTAAKEALEELAQSLPPDEIST